MVAETDNKNTAGEVKTESAEKNTEKKEKKKDEVSRLTKELEASKTALAEAIKKQAEDNDKYLRLAAEYDNFRRRSVKEREGIYSDAYAEAVKQLLPILDNFERAAAYSSGDALADGVKMILKGVPEALSKMGVSEIECKTFDPNLHNAVMHVEDEAYGEGEIVEVLQKGYIRGDKVIRYAMVKVAN